MKILVVEDKLDMLQILSEFLEGSGHVVDAVSDGQQALLRIANWSAPLDLVITDRNMPGGVLGEEVVRQAKARGAKTILMTTEDETIISVARAAGVDYVLRKPFSLEDLYQTISDLALHH